MEAIIGKSYLTEIPHEGRNLSFQYPAFKGNYANVAEQIDKENLKRPSSAETASLIYEAWKVPKGEKESEIISILKNNWFWEFTGNLYLPKSNEEINNGVILDLDSQNLKFENAKLIMNKNELIKRLNSNDKSVKFVPFGFKTEDQNLFEFQKNPYIKARYGEEGAEKIAEVASKYSKNPYIWSFNSVNEEKTRMSALDYGWSFDDRLDVGGDVWDGGGDGLVFGVMPQKK